MRAHDEQDVTMARLATSQVDARGYETGMVRSRGEEGSGTWRGPARVPRISHGAHGRIVANTPVYWGAGGVLMMPRLSPPA